MEMCYYPAFIIVNSFRKTFERMMCQNLSCLCVCDGQCIRDYACIRDTEIKNT